MYASGHSVQEAKLSDRLARGDDGVSQSYTSLPWGVSGRTGQLCGMSQSSSWQTSRDLSTRLGDSTDAVAWVQKRQKWSLFHPYLRAVGLTGATTAGGHVWVQLRWRSIISTWLLWGIAAYKGRGTAGDEREAS